MADRASQSCCPRPVRRLAAAAYDSLWLVVLGVAILAWLVFGGGGAVVRPWLARQLHALGPVFCVKPVPEGHEYDLNFWAGQVPGLLVVCAVCYLAINHTKAWERYVLPYLFYAEWQQNAFRYLGLQTLKGVVFQFVSRQFAMVSSWLFMPAGANELPGRVYPRGDVADIPVVPLVPPQLDATLSTATSVAHTLKASRPWPAAIRHWTDGKIMIIMYLTVSMVWFGVEIGLFRAGGRGGVRAKTSRRPRRGDRPKSVGLLQHNLSDLSRRIPAILLSPTTVQWVQFVAVAMLRTYPALNAAGVDLGTALLCTLVHFPVSLLVLGSLAIYPARRLGHRIRQHYGLSFSGVLLMNSVNLVAVLWAQQAGRALAGPVLERLPHTKELVVPVTLTLRLLVLMVFGCVLSVYLHAVSVLYGGSPVFLCEWGMPRFKKVSPRNMPAVERYLQALRQPLTSASRHATPPNQPQPQHQHPRDRPASTRLRGATMFRGVLGIGLALRRLWSGQEALTVAFTFSVHVKNHWAHGRTLRVKGLRLVLNVGDNEQVLAASVEEVVVPPGECTMDIDFLATLGVDGLLAIARQPDALNQMDLTLCADSNWSDKLVFTFPLVTYDRGVWSSIVSKAKLAEVPAKVLEDKRRLGTLLTRLRAYQQATLEAELGSAHHALQNDLQNLLVVLKSISDDAQAMADGELMTVDAALLEDLLEAAYYLVSVHVSESKLGRRNKAAGAALLQTASVVMNMFYEAGATQLAGGRDPMHLLLLTALMMCLQAFLYPKHLIGGDSGGGDDALGAGAGASTGAGAAAMARTSDDSSDGDGDGVVAGIAVGSGAGVGASVGRSSAAAKPPRATGGSDSDDIADDWNMLHANEARSPSEAAASPVSDIRVPRRASRTQTATLRQRASAPSTATAAATAAASPIPTRPHGAVRSRSAAAVASVGGTASSTAGGSRAHAAGTGVMPGMVSLEDASSLIDELVGSHRAHFPNSRLNTGTEGSRE